DQPRPEPREPAPGLPEGGCADPGLVGAGLELRERERAVVGGGCALDDLAAQAELHRHAGEAELTRFDLAGHAAAGLEVAPDDAGDVARFRRRRDRLLRA